MSFLSGKFRHIGLLTSQQVEVLRVLARLGKRSADRYWRPMDAGAFKSSHHSQTLKRLQRKGLVDSVELRDEKNARPRALYRINAQGLEALSMIQDMSGICADAVLGGSSAQARVSALRLLAA